MAVQTLSAPRRRSGLADRLAALPYWLLATILLGIILFWNILSNSDYNTIFQAVSQGVGVTVYVCLVSFAGALIIGLVVGMARLSSSRFVIEISSFYVEILRGVPMLVLLYYVAFVGAPGLVDLINWAGDGLVRLGVTGMGAAWADFSVRDLDFTTRAMIALVVGYSAFISEIFRAGIESIERGQTEAARSMGMNYWQTMRFIILPQAVRRVLPPLGNDFIAMLKDSALVSVLGVQDITQMGKLYASSTFRFFETYNVVAFLYLAMTVALSLVVRYMEKRMPRG